MFHVKHKKNKYNILHVHIGDRTRARTRRRTRRRAQAGGRRQAQAQAGGGQRTSGKICACLLDSLLQVVIIESVRAMTRKCYHLEKGRRKNERKKAGRTDCHARFTQAARPRRGFA